MRPEDVPAIERIMLDNHRRLSQFGESQYDKYHLEDLAKGTNMVAERSGEIICFCQYRPDPRTPTDAIVPCFVVATKYHDSGTYIRAQIEMERHIQSRGFRRILVSLLPGHDKFWEYLTKRRGYVPYAQENGTRFMYKELKDVLPNR